MAELPGLDLRAWLDRPRRCDIEDCGAEGMHRARLTSGPAAGLRLRLCSGHVLGIRQAAEEQGWGVVGDGWEVRPRPLEEPHQTRPDDLLEGPQPRQAHGEAETPSHLVQEAEGRSEETGP